MGSTSWLFMRQGCGQKSVKMFSKVLSAIVVFGCAAVSAYSTEELMDFEEDAADPRLFFTNFTSGLLAVNTTILTYAALIIAAGGVVGLVLYYLATSPQSRYSQQYGNSQYYSSSRMFNDLGINSSDFDLMGLISTAFEVYKKMNTETSFYCHLCQTS